MQKISLQVKNIYKILFFIGLFTLSAFSQVENVQITHPVYTFLKEMKVKGTIDYFREDESVISRFEVLNLLNIISESRNSLSSTEIKLLDKFFKEFSDTLDPEISTYIFNTDNNLFTNLAEGFSDKVKHLYAYHDESANLYLEAIGHFYHGQKFKPGVNNSNLFDIGFRLRGTVFDKLGYNVTLIKGGVSGDFNLAEVIEPRLLTNFKWIEAAENIGNYDYTFGYLKYHTSPVERMNISVQLGREDITLGYGYGSKLVLSGDNPAMDFIKFNFDYGILHFTSLHASTVGPFTIGRDDRYTKYFAFNKIKFVIPGLFDLGMGESIIYSGRALELGYLSPVNFYKFVEMALQDRDNGNLYIDLQTKFVKNLELQGTFFLDENILSNLQDLEKYTNKTAYQLGAFWYSPFGLNDLSLLMEYTRIRPFTYTHFNEKNNYSSFGTNLGHRIGPNADEILTRIAYNFNENLRFKFEHSFVRRGENEYDQNGNLVKNVGSDIFLTHGETPVSEKTLFLDGVRVNQNSFRFGARWEPVREFIFDLSYNYILKENLDDNSKNDIGFALLKFTLEY
jgi:hypothetical protein